MKIHCVECGKTETRRWRKSFEEELKRRSLCFHCCFWHRLIDVVDDPRSVRVDGKHHFIGREDAKGFRGCAGARYTIEFHDGRRVETTNLWNQGEIPERFRDRLPDNAIFIPVKLPNPFEYLMTSSGTDQVH